MTSAAPHRVGNIVRSANTGKKIQTRRLIWLMSFGLFSLVLMALNPGIGNLLALVAGLSICGCIWGSNTAHLECKTNIFGTVMGGMLSASLLGVAIFSGNYFVNLFAFEMQGLSIAFSTFFGFLFFCGLTVLETCVNLVYQLLFSRISSKDARIAYQIDLRFGGFLGELAD